MTTNDELLAMALLALRGLFEEPLQDWTYSVREDEGQGWEGPRVKKYSESVDLAEKVIKAADEAGL